MNVEVRIHISPTPAFFRQVEYVWRSFLACGGITATAQFIVFIGEDCDPFDVPARYAWAREANIEWRFIDREKFRRMSYFAPDRIRMDTDADLVLFLDADTVLIRPLDDIIVSLLAQPVAAGVMAHVPPFRGSGLSWEQVFASVGYRLPVDRFQHLGWGTMYNEEVNRFAPIYYNFGAVFVPGPAMKDFGPEYERCLDLVFERAAVYAAYRAQFALTLAIYKVGLPHLALEPRFNFPNLDWAERKFLIDLADVRVLHYLNEEVLGPRPVTWGSEEAFHAFYTRKDLGGANEILRARVASLARPAVAV